MTGLGKGGRQDKDEAAMDKAKGRMKEAAGSLTGDKKTKREGEGFKKGRRLGRENRCKHRVPSHNHASRD